MSPLVSPMSITDVLQKGAFPGQRLNLQIPGANFANCILSALQYPCSSVDNWDKKNFMPQASRLVKFLSSASWCQSKPLRPWLMVIAPGNGYDRCFTAGFTPRALTEECCRETHPDTALASENIFNLVLTSDLLMDLNFGNSNSWTGVHKSNTVWVHDICY